jgi:hypothetical protein
VYLNEPTRDRQPQPGALCSGPSTLEWPKPSIAIPDRAACSTIHLNADCAVQVRGTGDDHRTRRKDHGTFDEIRHYLVDLRVIARCKLRAQISEIWACTAIPARHGWSRSDRNSVAPTAPSITHMLPHEGAPERILNARGPDLYKI